MQCPNPSQSYAAIHKGNQADRFTIFCLQWQHMEKTIACKNQRNILERGVKQKRLCNTEYSGLKRPGYRGSGTIVPQQ